MQTMLLHFLNHYFFQIDRFISILRFFVFFFLFSASERIFVFNLLRCIFFFCICFKFRIHEEYVSDYSSNKCIQTRWFLPHNFIVSTLPDERTELTSTKMTSTNFWWFVWTFKKRRCSKMRVAYDGDIIQLFISIFFPQKKTWNCDWSCRKSLCHKKSNREMIKSTLFPYQFIEKYQSMTVLIPNFTFLIKPQWQKKKNYQNNCEFLEWN